MNQLINIFQEIKSSFGNLWNTKQRGNSLEIITPFATTSHKFISLFLSFKEGEYIISDGGWIHLGVYENKIDPNNICYNKILFHYQNAYNIQETKNNNEIVFYYRKTINATSVPSLIFDVANFVSAILSASEINNIEVLETETKERFRSNANEFLASFIPKEKVNFKGHLDPEKKIKISAIITKRSSELILVNYITGFNKYNFTNNISRTIMFFEMSSKSEFRNNIVKKVSLIENIASGYNQIDLASYLNHLEVNTDSLLINWSDRINLKQLITN
jgi:hypothetical protein